MDLRKVFEESKKVTKATNFKVGHCSYSKKVLRELKAEIGNERFNKEVTAGRAYYIVMTLMEKERPDLYEWVKANRGRKFKSQVGAHLSEIKKEQ